MEASFYSNGFSLQASFHQAKGKNSEAAVQTPFVKTKGMDQLQTDFAEKRVKVQEGDKANTHQSSFQTSHESLLDISQRVSKKLQEAGIKVQLNFDREQGRVIILVKDPVTDEVVRQIPSEDMQKIAESLKQVKPDMQLQGLEIDVKF